MCVPFSLSAAFARFLVRFFTQFCAASASFFFPELKMNLKIAEKITDGYWKKVLDSSRNDHKNHRTVERVSIVRFTLERDDPC